MSAVKKLLHTRYRVNDLEKTVRFYTDVLGLQEVRRHKSPRGSELVFLRTPNSDELIEIFPKVFRTLPDAVDQKALMLYIRLCYQMGKCLYRRKISLRKLFSRFYFAAH